MKKRRVLALFLVLSIVFGSGGFTTLAAGSDSYVDENAVSATADDTELIDNAEDSGINNTDETGTNEAEDSKSDESGQAETDGVVENGVESDISDENDGTETDSWEDNNDEETDTSDENSGTEMDASEETDASDDDAEANGEQKADEATASRILSFTDETGMVITYDANVTDNYQYTVEDGVLVDVKTESGKPVSGNVVIAAGQGITAIGETAFAGNIDITYVKLPTGVTSINQNAFKGCTELKGIMISTGLTTIGESAFEECSKLTQMALPKTVTDIGSRAFYNDVSLFMIYMKDLIYGELQTIGDFAFYGCTALAEFCSDTEFLFPGSIQTIGASAFEKCSSIKKIVLPDSVATVGSKAFYQCTSLTEATLSKKLETISASAFSGCINLELVTFVSGNKIIATHAFDGCRKLGEVKLIASLTEVQPYAFNGCTGLRRVTVDNPAMIFGEDGTFPNRSDLYMIGIKGSTAEEYASSRQIIFLAYDSDEVEYFKCEIRFTPYSASDSIEVWLNTPVKDKKANEQNNNHGVRAGEELYVGIKTSGDSRLVAGSLKCNGTPITPNSLGEYIFKMPKGGALITAEFESKNESKIIDSLSDEKDVDLRLSNGEERLNGNGVQLKIGQSTRLFLIDTSAVGKNSVIPASKITFKSLNTQIASISDTGVIKALKTGEAQITATVKGINSTEIKKTIYVDVVKVNVDSLKIKISSDSNVEMDDTQGIQTLSINKTALNGKSLTIQATATAYDAEDDDMAVALKWSSSDSTVAKLATTSTTDAKSDNTITIPSSASGEATVTVTATNSDKDKTKVTGKFIIRVRDFTPVLASSSLTLNPNQEKGTVLEIIGAYGTELDEEVARTVKLVDRTTGDEEFALTYDRASSTSTIARFYVEPGHKLVDGTKLVYVNIKKKDILYDNIPLKITIKSSYPSPKVAFDKKQKKINLFYANDETEIKPVISSLGSAEISEYSLESLSTDKDKLFEQNFSVDSDGIITQISDGMLYYKDGKPAVTGYLVLKFEGYKDYTKKYKITIPTQTTKPSYQLDKTSGTFNVGNSCIVTLKLIDKKTKEQIILDDNCTIDNLNGSVIDSRTQYSINSEGAIELTIPGGQKAGKAKFSINNGEWASGMTYNYTIKTSKSDPKITLKSSSVSVNKNFPEQAARFVLSSNQLDTQFANSQEFIAQAPAGKEDEYAKLNISCDEYGNGQVEILSQDIAKGTYKYTCDVNGNDIRLNRVTLTVKVTDTAPTVSAKGSVSLNRLAANAEFAELALTYKNLPAEYELDEKATADSIKCVTRDAAGLEDSFLWQFEENKLIVSLQEAVALKTYTFEMTPEFVGGSGSDNVVAKKINFKVKVYNGTVSVKLTTKGKVNLLDRDSEEYTQKNSIICTPVVSNLKDTIGEAKVYDVTNSAVEYEDEESAYFEAEILEGKLYVTPRAEAEIENNKSYKVKVWVKLNNYSPSDQLGGGMWCSNTLTIKTAQTLPKITIDKTSVSLYTSRKDYETSFVVTPKKGSIGKISEITFDEKDEKSWDSLELSYAPQEDGSLIVTMKLNNPSYPCNVANKIKMYVKFEGQGVNTKGIAITMNVKIIS